MAEINLENGFNFTRDDLLCLGIYELRDLGRDVGVCSPTTLKKENLVDAILGVVYGEIPKRKVGKGRGRPTRRMEKPSKIFLDLVDKSNSPRCETNIISSKVPDEFCFTARVASFAKEYLDDEDDGVGVVAEGIVCKEENGFFVRKYKFVPSETDVKIDDAIVNDHSLRDNDVIEYFSSSGKEVTEVLKINGSSTGVKLQSKDFVKKENYNEKIDNINLVMNSDNLIFSDDVINCFDTVSEKLNKKGYLTIKLNYNRTSPIGKNIFNKGQMEYYVDTIGDEFETMAVTEQAVGGLKIFGSTGERVVLMIEDISWLYDVIETYPKSLYGTYVKKILGLTKDPSLNATVVAFAQKGTKNKEVLKSIFTNKIEL